MSVASSNVTQRFPVLFISHGGPPLALDKADPVHRFFLDAAANLLPRTPKAIVCFSAHWETSSTVEVTSSAQPDTIHDFYGFDDELYQLRYTAPGDPSLASRIVEMLRQGGVDAKLNPTRGLDHGTWIPLYLMFPEAKVPVIQVSLLRSLDPAAHVAIGKALAPLRSEDVLLLGSGSLTHNLAEFRQTTASPHAREFHSWVHETLTSLQGEEREQRLVQFKSLQKDWRRVHPREEHFVPLFCALGAATAAGGDKVVAQRVTDHWYGSLNCASYRFDDSSS